MHRLQPLSVDIVGKGITLFAIICSAVDDDTLLGLVAYYIGVLLQQVEHESLYFEH